MEKHTGQFHSSPGTFALRRCENAITQREETQIVFLPPACPHGDARSECLTTPYRNTSGGMHPAHGATPHTAPQKHSTEYPCLTCAWGPRLPTAPATERETSSQGIKVIMFYLSTGNLSQDKPASFNNTGAVIPRTPQLGI